ncbi:MAG: glutamine--tRNA ligase/YqeY domain fusion protein [Saprospiraceae bacterium]|jgi:glutaminyl-tRNA synthetase|nr:glutamine--tRNA ligase/YqeY domain fusion protein [Saprospiraceae bacterium]
MSTESKESLNFIEQIVEEDIASGKHNGAILTRFPPEPNGYLHIGHAKALWVNFGISQKYGGKTNLRFDDTNPTTEETEFVDSIKEDIEWLGYEWDGEPLYASDYFPQLYQFAIDLIKKGLAYVEDSSAEEIGKMKGDIGVPGQNSPYRDRQIEENLRLFEGMKNGEFPDGTRVLRAKIDMAHPNLLLRDPVLYRIKHETHHRTGDDWCIYPLYDFAHGQSDSIENITHSLCSLEFRHHRDLYDWLIEKLEIFPSRQIEFARMNVEYMITSKRRLLKLVNEHFVNGWNDPRMPTLSGMRRRGYPPAAIRNFCRDTGLAKRDNLIEINKLEYAVRQELNKTAPRVMGVLDPLKVVITNYPEGKTEDLTLINNPEDESQGSRILPFSREIYIEKKDFMEDPPRKFFRLGPGKNVRLKGAYIVHCDGFVKDESTGEVTEVHCTYYEDSKSGSDTSGVKSKGVLHWVSIDHAVKVEVREYDRLFTEPSPLGHEGKDFLEFFNSDSLVINDNAFVEPSLKNAKPGDRFQFMRMGYYCLDEDSNDEHLVFNRTVTLKDTWAKVQKKNN